MIDAAARLRAPCRRAAGCGRRHACAQLHTGMHAAVARHQTQARLPPATRRHTRAGTTLLCLRLRSLDSRGAGRLMGPIRYISYAWFVPMWGSGFEGCMGSSKVHTLRCSTVHKAIRHRT